MATSLHVKNCRATAAISKPTISRDAFDGITHIAATAATYQ